VLAAKLAALAVVPVPFELALFATGAVTSYVITQIEDAPISWPSAWLLARAIAAGGLILAVWAALGVLLGVLTRGTSLAIGVGIPYALVIEGLPSAFADSVTVLEPLTNVFVRPKRARDRDRARSLVAEHRIKRAGDLQPAVRGQPADPRRARRLHRRLRRALPVPAATPRRCLTPGIVPAPRDHLVGLTVAHDTDEHAKVRRVEPSSAFPLKEVSPRRCRRRSLWSTDRTRRR
jgi:hypothetical protein